MIRVLILTLMAVLVVSCGQVSRPLSNTAWQLIAVNGNRYENQNTPVLRFGDDTLEGKGVCNSYSAEYQLNGDALTIAPIVATEMSCDDMILNIVEREYFTTLNVVTRYAIVGEELQLFDLNGVVVALFRKSAS